MTITVRNYHNEVTGTIDEIYDLLDENRGVNFYLVKAEKDGDVIFLEEVVVNQPAIRVSGNNLLVDFNVEYITKQDFDAIRKVGINKIALHGRMFFEDNSNLTLY